MAASASQLGAEPDDYEATISHLRVAVSLVGRGFAGCVTIVGLPDAEAAAAAVAGSAPGVSIEIVSPLGPAAPSTLRIRRKTAGRPVSGRAGRERPRSRCALARPVPP